MNEFEKFINENSINALNCKDVFCSGVEENEEKYMYLLGVDKDKEEMALLKIPYGFFEKLFSMMVKEKMKQMLSDFEEENEEITIN